MSTFFEGNEVTITEKERLVTRALSSFSLDLVLYLRISKLVGEHYYDFIRQMYFVLRFAEITEKKINIVLGVVEETGEVVFA